MEAPEKIYLTPLECMAASCQPQKDNTVEYVRADVFTEKADEFIGSFFHPDDTELRNCLLKKFHEYMKGE